MRKSAVALAGVLAALSLLLALPAAAQAGGAPASQENERASAGVMPDSPLYFLDTALARLSLALTFNKAAKAEKGLSIAQERLLEVSAMIEQSNLGAAAKAEREYEHSLEAAASAASAIESGNDPTAAVDALHKISALQNQTESHYEKVMEIKDRILQNKNSTMNEQQISHLKAVFGKIEENARNMEIKLDMKNKIVKSKEKVLANLTSEQITALDEQIKEETGLAKGRQERAENGIERARAALEKAKEEANEKEAIGINVSEIEDVLEEAEEQAGMLNASDADDKSEQYHAEELENFGDEVSSLARSLGEAREEGNFSDALNRLKETIEERRVNRSAERPERASGRSWNTTNSFRKRGDSEEEDRITEKERSRTEDRAERQARAVPVQKAAQKTQSREDSSDRQASSSGEQPDAPDQEDEDDEDNEDDD